MTDDPDLDIVTELRLLAEIANSAEVGLLMISGRSFADAADAIEALREMHDHAELNVNSRSETPVTEYRNDPADGGVQ